MYGNFGICDGCPPSSVNTLVSSMNTKPTCSAPEVADSPVKEMTDRDFSEIFDSPREW
jgi:hypothetical protein